MVRFDAARVSSGGVTLEADRTVCKGDGDNGWAALCDAGAHAVTVKVINLGRFAIVGMAPPSANLDKFLGDEPEAVVLNSVGMLWVNGKVGSGCLPFSAGDTLRLACGSGVFTISWGRASREAGRAKSSCACRRRLVATNPSRREQSSGLILRRAYPTAGASPSAAAWARGPLRSSSRRRSCTAVGGGAGGAPGARCGGWTGSGREARAVACPGCGGLGSGREARVRRTRESRRGLWRRVSPRVLQPRCWAPLALPL